MIRLLRFSQDVDAEHRAAGDQLAAAVAEAQAVFDRLGVSATANRWLADMQWKRALAAALVGDLLDGPRRTVVEIGGGLSGLTLALARTHDYRLLEKATHEREEDYRRVEEEIGTRFLEAGDWADVEARPADVLVANDIFPNVDQRLYEVVERYEPLVPELRFSLTYYENEVFEVERLVSGERLMMKPWGLRELRGFVDWLVDERGHECGPGSREQLVYEDLSGRLFRNRRNIVLAWITRAG